MVQMLEGAFRSVPHLSDCHYYCIFVTLKGFLNGSWHRSMFLKTPGDQLLLAEEDTSGETFSLLQHVALHGGHKNNAQEGKVHHS